MADTCSFPTCSRKPESNGYCISHQIYASGPIAKKAHEPVKKCSSKMKGVKKELAKLYGIFLARPENKYCKVQIDSGCTKIATTVHHVKGRIGEQVFVQKDWLPSCWHCNVELENKDEKARQKGVKKSKYSPKVIVSPDPEDPTIMIADKG